MKTLSTMMAILSVILLVSIAQAAPKQLCWTPSIDTDIASYRVDYGTVKGGPYPTSKNIGKPALATSGDCAGLAVASFTTIGIPVQDRLFYAKVVAIDTSGNISQPSFEVQFNPNPICEYSVTGTAVKDATGKVTMANPVFTPTKVCP